MSLPETPIAALENLERSCHFPPWGAMVTTLHLVHNEVGDICLTSHSTVVAIFRILLQPQRAPQNVKPSLPRILF
jgi:hypothetical protein